MKKSLIAILSFITLLSTFSQPVFAETVKIANNCGYVQSVNEDPDYQTINCLLTDTAMKYNVPPEIVKAIAWRENGWQHFDENGEAIISEDGGIGLMQITNVGNFDVEHLKNDIVYNIDAGVQILNDMFNRNDLPIINDGDRAVIENWYFAVMAYNGIKPVNSPIVQATGERNSEAYQEKVFQYIEENNLIDLVEIPFTSGDFEYDSNSTENIQFVTKHYDINLPFTESKHYFKKNQKVGATTNVYIRSEPTTESPAKGRLNKGEIVEITGPFQFDKSEGIQRLYNHFVWYPIKRSDGTTGYVASSYLDYRFTDVPEGHYAEDEIYYLAKRGILEGIGSDKFGMNVDFTRWQAVLMVARANNLSLENRPDPGFDDVPKNHPYYKEIAAVVDEELFLGTEDGFQPNKTMTRAEMAVVLERLYDLPDTNTTPPFTDLKYDWYKNAVTNLYAAGITEGVDASGKTFAPNMIVTREQFAVFMVRAMDDEYRLK